MVFFQMTPTENPIYQLLSNKTLSDSTGWSVRYLYADLECQLLSMVQGRHTDKARQNRNPYMDEKAGIPLLPAELMSFHRPETTAAHKSLETVRLLRSEARRCPRDVSCHPRVCA